MGKTDIIQEILTRKVVDRNPDISDIVERYELTSRELEAVEKYENRIDRYMDFCHGCVPDQEGRVYVPSDRTAYAAMKIATTVPLVVFGGVGMLMRKHILRTAAVAVATTAASRAVERRYGIIAKGLEKKGPASWAATMSVHLAGKNLERVLEAEKGPEE